MHNHSIRAVATALALALLMTVSSLSASDTTGKAAENIKLQVFKSPTCGCCGAWVDHAEQSGIATQTIVREPGDLSALKARFGIPNRYQSCHTAVSHDGYVFEGHIPAKVIRRFLAAPPSDVIGLTVPGMPVGSPGMVVGDNFMPYQVLLLKKDGSTEVYAEFSTAAEQF